MMNTYGSTFLSIAIHTINPVVVTYLGPLVLVILVRLIKPFGCWHTQPGWSSSWTQVTKLDKPFSSSNDHQIHKSYKLSENRPASSYTVQNVLCTVSRFYFEVLIGCDATARNLIYKFYARIVPRVLSLGEWPVGYFLRHFVCRMNLVTITNLESRQADPSSAIEVLSLVPRSIRKIGVKGLVSTVCACA